MIEGRLPTVIEYYAEHINSGVNLASNPKQCCPFHEEKTPSFSYNIKTGRWTCFGRCHASGDVIDMHQRWYHFNDRAEAERDIRIKYNARKQTDLEAMRADSEFYISESDVEDQVTYAQAVSMANTPKRWLELDYVMSKSPYNRLDVQDLIIRWKEEAGA